VVEMAVLRGGGVAEWRELGWVRAAARTLMPVPTLCVRPGVSGVGVSGEKVEGRGLSASSSSSGGEHGARGRTPCNRISLMRLRNSRRE
jgi:hypothetical protein